jgi:Tfp pilus assembly ATPase PilU
MHLYRSGLITIEEALRNASNADEFRMRVHGILSSTEQAKEELKKMGHFSPALGASKEGEIKV